MSIPLLQLVVPAPLPTKSPIWPKQYIKKWSPWFLQQFPFGLHIFDKPSPLAPKISQPARPTTTVGPQTTYKKHPGYYSLCAPIFWRDWNISCCSNNLFVNLAQYQYPQSANMKRGNYEGGPSPGAAPAAKKLHRGDKFEGKIKLNVFFFNTYIYEKPGLKI